jgi:hypothetical protein
MQFIGNSEPRALIGKVSPLWVQRVSRRRIQPRFQTAFIVASTVKPRWTNDYFTIPASYTCRVKAAGAVKSKMLQPANTNTKMMAEVLIPA